MKLIIFLSIFIINSLFAYNITPEKLTREINNMNMIVFKNRDINKWNMLMIGTIAAETSYGANSGNGRHGITQITTNGLKFINSRMTEEDRIMIKDVTNVDSKSVNISTLRHNNRLSILYAALYFKYSTTNPPNDINEAARLWKKHYNTSAGRGTINGFIRKYNSLGKEEYEKIVADKSYVDRPRVNIPKQRPRLVDYDSSTVEMEGDVKVITRTKRLIVGSEEYNRIFDRK